MDVITQDLHNFPIMGIIFLILCIMVANCFNLNNKFDLIGWKFYGKLSEMNAHRTSAVVTNSEQCTTIGILSLPKRTGARIENNGFLRSDILKRGGSAADAAIASLLCEGVSNPQSMGIGGGFLLTIYNKLSGTAEVLNARECAPIAATKEMFGKPSDEDIEIGGLSAAVPGELKGYWELHVKYGKLPWSELFKPVINICRNGIYVTQHTAKMLDRIEEKIMKSSSLKAIFINKETGKIYRGGEYMKRPMLANTLEYVSKEGPDALYNGVLTKGFLEDIKENGGIITAEDLIQYTPKWQTPLVSELRNNLTVFSVPSPGAGEMVLTVLDVLSGMLPVDPITFWHRIVEALKFAFGIKTLLNGPKIGENENLTYVYDDYLAMQIRQSIDDNMTYNESAHYFAHFDSILDGGTCHVGILAPNGDAVAVTSTINSNLGAMFASKTTGIILNNEMMDFGIPYHHPWKLNPANYIEPKKQPMSSMCPTIIINNDDKAVRLIIGAAGGPKIITSTIQVIIRNLWLKQNIISAVKAKRLHHQLQPMLLEYEEGFPKYILDGLSEKGHKLVRLNLTVPVRNVVKMPVYSTVNAISRENDVIFAVGDPRRGAHANTL